MKFLVDANLPRALSAWLCSLGHDAIHTLDLPLQNSTGDNEILHFCREQERILVTKDSDFEGWFQMGRKPHALVLVAVGNISNDSLIALFERQHTLIIANLSPGRMIELRTDTLVIWD